MQKQIKKSFSCRGKISVNGFKWSPAILFIKSNQLILHYCFTENRFKPHQIIAIEPIGAKSIFIKHIVNEYPAKIYFTPFTCSASEVIEESLKINFFPSAKVEDILVKEGIPIRLPILFIIIFSVFCLGRESLNTFILSILDNLLVGVTLHPAQAGQYSPLGISVMLIVSLLTRHISYIQNLIMQPGRKFGEIIPILNVVDSFLGTLLIAVLLLFLNIPNFLAFVFSFSILFLVIKNDINQDI